MKTLFYPIPVHVKNRFHPAVLVSKYCKTIALRRQTSPPVNGQSVCAKRYGGLLTAGALRVCFPVYAPAAHW
jgi:hypothetical protein